MLQPLVYGRTVQLSPLIVLIAVLMGAELAGVIGALGAIPVAGAIQVIVVDWLAHRRRQDIARSLGPPRRPRSTLRPDRCPKRSSARARTLPRALRAIRTWLPCSPGASSRGCPSAWPRSRSSCSSVPGAGYGDAGLVAAAYSRRRRRRCSLRGSAGRPARCAARPQAPDRVSTDAVRARRTSRRGRRPDARDRASLPLPPGSRWPRSRRCSVDLADRARAQTEPRTAYALDAALQEVIFVGGPLLVAVLARRDRPVAAVLGAAVAGGRRDLRLRAAPSRAGCRPSESHTARDSVRCQPSGCGRSRSSSLWLGLGFGAVEIAAPAFAEAEGNRALAGLPSPASRRDRSSAGSSRACARRATSDGESSSARSALTA